VVPADLVEAADPVFGVGSAGQGDRAGGGDVAVHAHLDLGGLEVGDAAVQGAGGEVVADLDEGGHVRHVVGHGDVLEVRPRAGVVRVGEGVDVGDGRAGVGGGAPPADGAQTGDGGDDDE